MTKSKLSRISLTIPETLLTQLDNTLVSRHYESRSQAIVDMINNHLIEQTMKTNAVMVGTLTLLYDASQSNIQLQIIELQRTYLSQVISSLHIQLDSQKILEVMIIQGQSETLQQISAQFSALKGVVKGHLELMDAVIPPIEQNEIV